MSACSSWIELISLPCILWVQKQNMDVMISGRNILNLYIISHEPCIFEIFFGRWKWDFFLLRKVFLDYFWKMEVRLFSFFFLRFFRPFFYFWDGILGVLFEMDVMPTCYRAVNSCPKLQAASASNIHLAQPNSTCRTLRRSQLILINK